MTPVRMRNPARSMYGRQYRADLEVEGVVVGRVERAMTQGYRPNEYKAIVEGITVATDPTLDGLRVALDEWVEDERQLEQDAVWLRIKRSEQ